MVAGQKVSSGDGVGGPAAEGGGKDLSQGRDWKGGCSAARWRRDSRVCCIQTLLKREPDLGTDPAQRPALS